MESRLSVLESTCAPMIERIVSKKSVEDLSESEHRILCLFVAVQMQRTNHSREQLSEINHQMTSWIRDSGYDPDKDVENFKIMSSEEIKQSSIQLLHDLSMDFAKHLTSKKLSLLVCQNEETFLLSDNPVTLYNHAPIEGRGNLGLKNKGIEIFLPISPNVCLSFFCEKTYLDLINTVNKHKAKTTDNPDLLRYIQEIEKTIDSLNNNRTRTLRTENIEFNNSLQVIQSSRFLYSKVDDFSLAIEMIQEDLALSRPLSMEFR